MLQQTQVSRVISKYSEFLNVFPTIQVLASGSAAQVLRVWKGMGYNRRALYLHRSAKVIVEMFEGMIPISEQLLSKLPGVGTYTARAILVFAFEKDIAMVDTNIRRIITHYFFAGKPQTDKIIQNVADQILPIGKSWAWHQALMDYGSLEMSKIKGSIQTRDKKNIPFHESNRYYRGRVIDALRDGPKLVTELLVIANSHVIESLLKDGLIERKDVIYTLPD